jgi:iron complex outermembrane receptor protein
VRYTACRSLLCALGLLACAGGSWPHRAGAQQPIEFPEYAYDAIDPADEEAAAVGGPQMGFEHGQLVSYMVPEDLQRQVTERALREEESPFAGYFADEAETPEIATPQGFFEEAEDSRGLESRGAADTGTALQDSPSVQTLNVQRRSSVAFDPRIRGFHIGQVWAQAEGVYWTPVRQDLDSMLARIDPRMIDSLRIVPGPYAARYGPGFAFIDIDLADTPRYCDCPQSHNRFGYVYRGNGSQHYAIDTFYGGGADYGYIGNYSYRNGADYLAGNGQRIPGSYLINAISTQLGFDLSSGARLEMRYDFLNQLDTQIPGQFFDLDKLQTNAFAVSLIDDSQTAAWTRMRIDAWHNNTPARGTVRNEGVFNVQDRVEDALENELDVSEVFFNGTTAARVASSGGRWEYTFGEPDSLQLTTGVDVRHVKQRIDENFLVTDPSGESLVTIEPTQLPTSEMFNPGLYAEVELPMSYYWNASVGARVDYVHTTTAGIDEETTSQPFPDQLTQDDALYSFFLMNEVKLTESWTGTLGFGHAQRPPTLLERYADGVFVSIIQSGFTRVIGDSTLSPERLWQFDAGLAYNYCNTRAGVNFYHSWINDFITFRGLEVPDPSGARLIRYVPTDLATLWGGEARYEYDLSSTWTFLAAGHYVQGQDQTLGAPLWGISPLEGTLGLRWHTADDPNFLGMELLARFVDNQDRLGVLRTGNLEDVGQETFEQETDGFTTVNVRGYWNPREGLSFIAGIENLLDVTYLQHLDNRLPASGIYPAAFAYAPGITPYMGVDWEF